MEALIGFTSGHGPVPPEVQNASGFFLSGRNSSDDLFMYLYRQVTGLAPNTAYRVDTSISFATDAPPGCTGVGGAPGEHVSVKAGATAVKPAKATNASNRVVVNFDKGNQGTGGVNAVVLGNVAQEAPGDCLNRVFKRKTLTSGSNGPTVTSDAAGSLWLVIGTDSGFEATTNIYYLEGTATFTPT